jgi:autotransporter-associated beta strand protein
MPIRTSRVGSVLERLGLRNRKKSKGVRPSKPRSHSFEPLERRELLSITWTGGGANNNWSTATNWNLGRAPTSGDDVVLAGTAQTSTNDDLGGLQLHSIEFQNSGFSIGGSNLAVTSGITVDSGVTGSTITAGMALGGAVGVDVEGSDLTLSGIVSGSNSLTKIGGGTLTLDATNTYSGATTVSAGTLALDGDPGNSGYGTIPYTSGLTINGSGTVRVDTSNGLAGYWGNNISIPPVVVNTGGTLTMADGVTCHLGDVTLAGGTLTGTTSPNSQWGSWCLDHQVHVTAASTLGATAMFAANSGGGGFNVDANTELDVLGTLTDCGYGAYAATVLKSGPGTMVLDGLNTYSGGTVVSAGTLLLGSDTALGTGSVDVQSGATLDLNGHSTGSLPITIAGAGVNGQGALVNSDTSGSVQNVNDLILAGDATIGGSGGIQDDGTLSTGGHAYNLTKVGANQFVLVGAAVDSALNNLDIQDGVLSFQSGSGMGNVTGTVTVAAGATLGFWNQDGQAYRVSGKAVLLNGGTLRSWDGNVTFGGQVTAALSGSTSPTIEVDAGTLTLLGSVINLDLVTTTGSGTLAFAPSLPSGWSDADIGNPGIAGSAVYDGATWTVAGGGSDIWNNADQFNFASESVTGDGTIVAQVDTITNTDPWAKAGVMFRDDGSAGAAFVDMVASAGQGVSFQWRDSADGGCNYVQIGGVNAPVWVKLVRSGDDFSGFYSSDGVTWTQCGGTQTISMDNAVLAGLAVTAHNNAALNTATFSDVAVTLPPPPPPVQHPDIWVNGFSAAADQNSLQVTYQVDTTNSAAPFQIGLYTSVDGIAPDQPFGEPYSISDPSLLTPGAHTISFTAPYQDVSSDYRLIAVVNTDSTPAESTLEFAGGIFVGTDTTVPAQSTVYVFGTAQSETITLDNEEGATYIHFGATDYCIDSSVTAIHIRTEGGNDHVFLNAAIPAAVSIFDGSGNDTIGAATGTLMLPAGGLAIDVPDSGTVTIASSVEGTRGLTKTGEGTLVLTGDNPYSGVTAVSSGTLDVEGNLPSSNIITSGDGQFMGTGAIAQQTISGLTPGVSYDLWVTWTANSSHSANIPFQIYDGSSYLNTVLVDQTQAPTSTDSNYATYFHLGVFSSTSGTLTVQALSEPDGTAQGGTVVATASTSNNDPGEPAPQTFYRVTSLSFSVGETQSPITTDNVTIQNRGWISAANSAAAALQALGGTFTYTEYVSQTQHTLSFPSGCRAGYVAEFNHIPGNNLESSFGLDPKQVIVVFEDWTDGDWNDDYWLVGVDTGTPKVNIDTDSNNDGTIVHSTDAPVEDGPGRFVAVHVDSNDPLAQATIDPIGITVPVAGNVTATLSASSNIKVFTDATGTTALFAAGQSSCTWDAYNQTLPASVYVEGVTPGLATLTWTVTVAGVSQSDVVDFTVIPVNIDTDTNNDGVISHDTDDPSSNPAYEETAPGRYVGLYTGSTTQLAEVDITPPGVTPTTSGTAIATLTFTGGIRVWTDTTRTKEITSGTTYDLANSSRVPTSVFVEGDELGAATMTWTVTYGSLLGSDKVCFTVIDLHADGMPFFGIDHQSLGDSQTSDAHQTFTGPRALDDPQSLDDSVIPIADFHFEDASGDTINPPTSLGNFTATINWGDGTTGSGNVQADPDGVAGAYEVTGDHIYAHDGPYTVVIMVTDSKYGCVAFAASYGLIFDPQDDAKLQWDAGSTVDRTDTGSLDGGFTIHADGSYSVSSSGSGSFDYQRELDTANENGEDGLSAEEIGTVSSINVSASGTFDSNSFAVDTYTVDSSGSSTVTTDEFYSDFDNSASLTTTATVNFSDNKTATFTDDGGTYDWTASRDTTDGQVTGNGTTQTYRQDLGEQDALLLEDAAQLNRTLTNQDLVGQFSLTGTVTSHSDLTETGTYGGSGDGNSGDSYSGGDDSGDDSGDSFDSTLTTSETFTYTQTGTNQTQDYDQTATETDSSTVAENGTPSTGEFDLTASNTSSSTFDRHLTNQTLVVDRSGTTEADVEITDKTGNAETGQYDLTAETTTSYDWHEEQSNQGESIVTDASGTSDDTYDNQGDADEGSYAITDGSQDATSNVTTTDTYMPSVTTTTSSTSQHKDYDQSGDLYAGDYTLHQDTSGSFSTDTTSTDQTLSTSSDTTGTMTGTSDDSGSKGSGEFSLSQTNGSVSETGGNETDSSDDGGQLTIVTTTDATANTNTDSSGNSLDGSYDCTVQANGSTSHIESTATDGQSVTVTTSDTTDNSSSEDVGNAIDGSYDCTTRGNASTTHSESTATDGQSVTVTTSDTTDNSSSEDVGNSIDGSYDCTTHGNASTSDSDSTSTDGQSVIVTTTDSTDYSSGEDTGNSILGNDDCTTGGGGSTSHIESTATDGQSVTVTATDTTDYSSSDDSGDSIDGLYNSSTQGGGSTTHSESTATDGQSTTITTLDTIDNSSTGGWNNSISGDFDSSTRGGSTTSTESTTTDGQSTTVTTLDTTDKSSSDDWGNSINGDDYFSTAGGGSTSHTVSTETDGQSTTVTTLDTTDSSSSNGSSNSISGDYNSLTEGGGSTSDATSTETDGQSTTVTTLDTRDNSGTSDSGNTISADDYSLTQGNGSTTHATSTETDGQSTTTTTSDTTDNSSNGGWNNSISGDYTSSTQGGDSTTHVVNTATDGQSTTITISDATDNSSSSDSGNAITGDDSSSTQGGGSTTDTTSTETDGQMQTVTITSTTDNSSSGGSSNSISGDYSSSTAGGGSTTHTVSTQTDGQSTTVTTSDAADNSSSSESGNLLSGDYVSTTQGGGSASHTVSTATDGPSTTVTTTDTTDSSSGTDSGNSISGDDSSSTQSGGSTTDSLTTVTDGESTTVTTTDIVDNSSSTGTSNSLSGDYESITTTATVTTSHVVQTDATDTVISDNAATDSGTTNESGNSISGQYTSITSGDVHSLVTSHETNDGLDVYTTTTTDSYDDGTTETGNSISGDYASSGSGSTQTAVSQNGQAGDRSFVLSSTDNEQYASTAAGNTISGDSSSSQSGASIYTLSKADTYPDGSDTQSVERDGTGLLNTSSGNSISGDYSNSTSGTVVTTITESGDQGNPYSTSSTDTYVYSTTNAGNSIAGGYTTTTSSSDRGLQTRSGSDGNGGTFDITIGNDSQDTLDQTGNSLSGDFTIVSATQDETTTTHETSSTGGDSSTLDSTEIFHSSRTGSGNTLTGDQTTTDQETITTSLTQSGSNAGGSFSVTETTADSPVVVTTGNSISGLSMVTQTGAQTYTIHEENDDGSYGFVLDGGGTKQYSSTGTSNTITGACSSTETGTDAYSLTESGADVLGSYTQTLGGADDYTTAETSNSLSGGFTRTTSGSGDYTLVEQDGQNDPVTTISSHAFSDVDTGNYVDGQVSLSAAGVDHYHLLRGFSDTSNAANGAAPGTLDYSPVGAAFVLGAPVEGLTGGGARAAAVDAVFGDLGALPYQHCFRAGTPVLMADGTTKPIEEIQPGDKVRCASETDPEGAVETRAVVEVYHNKPAQLLELQVDGQFVYTTLNHPIYVRGRGWTAALQLQAGDQLRGDDGSWLPVGEARLKDRVEPVFNFQVEDYHTYFVGPLEKPKFLVHNASPQGPAPGTMPGDSGYKDQQQNGAPSQPEQQPQQVGQGGLFNYAFPGDESTKFWARVTGSSDTGKIQIQAGQGVPPPAQGTALPQPGFQVQQDLNKGNKDKTMLGVTVPVPGTPYYVSGQETVSDENGKKTGDGVGVSTDIPWLPGSCAGIQYSEATGGGHTWTISAQGPGLLELLERKKKP